MSYEHDIFVSYRRTTTVGRWVQRHFLPLLEPRLNEITPAPVRIFCDTMMEEGVNLPAKLRRCIRSSGLLLAVWSADYFRSSWCMTEWQSFREREKMLGLFCDQQPQGLVYPVLYADGDHFPPDARRSLCQKDFSRLNYACDAFCDSPKFLEFDDLVKQVANELAARLPTLPPWDPEFPVVEREPMAPASHPRPVI